MKEEIILTITMLVSDREDTIEKCLASLEGLRNAVPSELIVVDTAGNEKCMSVVRRYTENIVPFSWCDDFAAARNAGLEKAKGKWIMFLDDDEWFEDTKGLETFFKDGLYQRYKSASYLVRNYLNLEGTVWQDTTAVRLVKRQKLTRFEGKIHERLLPIEEPAYHTEDYAHHYGYAYRTKRERIQHSWRNIKLLLERRKENRNDYHTISQLIQEYGYAEEYFTALELIAELKNNRQGWNRGNMAFIAYALVTEVNIYCIQERYKEAYEAGKETLMEKELPAFVKGCIFNMLCGICFYLEKEAKTLEYIQKFRQFMLSWKKEDAYEQRDIARLSDRYLTPEEVKRFSFIELAVYVVTEEWEKAENVLQSIDWQEKDLRMLTTTPKDIVTILAHLPNCESGLEGLKWLAQDAYLWKSILQIIEKLDGIEQWNVYSYIYRLPLNNVEICKYHILYAGHLGKPDEIKRVLEEMQRKRFPLFIEDGSYWKVLRENQISFVPYTKDIRTYEWMQVVEGFMEKFTLEESEDFYLVLSKELEKKEIRFLYLTALWMEKRLLENTEQKDEWKELYNLALYWISCGAYFYKEEVFTGELLEAVPPRYRFAWYILQANSLKKNNNHQFIQKMAEAAKTYPAMKELCKAVIRESAGKDIEWPEIYISLNEN